jgi:hypothetical protein
MKREVAERARIAAQNRGGERSAQRTSCARARRPAPRDAARRSTENIATTRSFERCPTVQLRGTSTRARGSSTRADAALVELNRSHNYFFANVRAERFAACSSGLRVGLLSAPRPDRRRRAPSG